MSDGATLGSYVKERRDRLGMSLTALAIKAGLSKSELSALERGRISLPGADKRRRLAAALGVSHLDLLVAAGELTEAERGGAVERVPDSPVELMVAQVRALPPDLLGHAAAYVGFLSGQASRSEHPPPALPRAR